MQTDENGAVCCVISKFESLDYSLFFFGDGKLKLFIKKDNKLIDEANIDLGLSLHKQKGAKETLMNSCLNLVNVAQICIDDYLNKDGVKNE